MEELWALLEEEPELAETLQLTSDEAWWLARSYGDVVRSWLATNPGIGEDIQVFLTEDPDPSVRHCLTLNPNVTNEVLWRLFRDDVNSVRFAAIKLIDFTEDEETLFLKRNFSKHDFRKALAENPHLTAKTQHYFLTEEHSNEIREAFLTNPGPVWSLDVPVPLFVQYRPERIEEYLEGCDKETARALKANWRGSLRELLEATRLVNA